MNHKAALLDIDPKKILLSFEDRFYKAIDKITKHKFKIIFLNI